MFLKNTQYIKSIRQKPMKWVLMKYSVCELYGKNVMVYEKSRLSIIKDKNIQRRHFVDCKNWTQSYFIRISQSNWKKGIYGKENTRNKCREIEMNVPEVENGWYNHFDRETGHWEVKVHSLLPITSAVNISEIVFQTVGNSNRCICCKIITHPERPGAASSN